VGFAITALLLLTAALSLGYTPRDPLEMSMEARLQGPSEAHPLGTDQFGRDLLSRIMVGAVTAILVGVIAVGIGVGLGASLGMLSGYFGGWLDEVFMRLMDAVQGFPAILSALLIAAVFKPGLAITMVAIGVSFLPIFARLTRAAFLELRDREFVLAARALGAGDAAVIGRHILRSGAVLSRTRHPAAEPFVGAHAPGGAGLPRHVPLVRRVSGYRNSLDCARVEPAWRRAQRSPRSKDDELAQALDLIAKGAPSC
jgi:ABC-type antimicrobial peptide transport system permease subunit